MKNKKAALELSVNAIIILILAIVMLGLGLGFITGMFGKVSTQFEEQIAREPDPSAPSGSDPITLSRESIVTHAKDAEVLKVSLYNPSNGDWGNTSPYINCSTAGVIGNLQANAKTIKQGESDTFNVLFNVGSGISDGTYLCFAGIKNTTDYTRDFTIKVIK